MKTRDIPGWTSQRRLTDDRRTDALAMALKPRVGAGDVLLLSGPIGAGKSHFARALIRGFLAEHDALEDIPSPTYTLVQTYQAGELEIWHSDLYRLSSIREIEELGLLDAFDTALCLVEWPDRLEGDAPSDALTLDFAITGDEDQRLLTVSATDPKWRWLRDLLETEPADAG